MKTFQKPLSKEEESQCIQALQAGGSASKEAKDLLIERNLRLVAHIAKKYTNADEDMEDLISIGTIGLIKAVDSFDSSKNNRLAAYAARCIDNELLMMLRSKKKTSREVSLYEPIGTDREGNEISLLDVMEQEQPDVVEEMEQKRCLGCLLELLDSVLDDRERTIICRRFGLFGIPEITQKEIGRQMGISRSYVSRIEKRALEKLREGFEAKELCRMQQKKRELFQ